MSHLNNTFGVEIECFLPEGQNRQTLAAAINARLGDFSASAEGYNHYTSSNWKIITDGSLGDYTRGCEVVSPVLTGQEGLNKLAIVCDVLDDFGCTVNKKCGLHVHVGARDFSLPTWKNLIAMYINFEKLIDQMMPMSRRAGNNNFCRSMTTVNLNTINAANSFMDLIVAYRRITGDNVRYHKLNLAAYERHKTVEFRQHSGTVNAKKVNNWVITCLKMVQAAREQRVLPNLNAANPRNQARPGTKNYMIGEMLLRPNGVTSQEALAATGWTTCSVPEIAGFCGIPFTKVKMGRMTRYYAARGPVVEATVTSFGALIGLTAEEAVYMQTRITNLSGTVAWAA